MNPSWPSAFYFGVLLIIDSISLTDIALFGLPSHLFLLIMEVAFYFRNTKLIDLLCMNIWNTHLFCNIQVM